MQKYRCAILLKKNIHYYKYDTLDIILSIHYERDQFQMYMKYTRISVLQVATF